MDLVRRIARSRAAAAIATVLSIAVIAAATLFPDPGAQSPSGICVLCGDYGLTDFVLNTLLFMPFGFALRWTGVSVRRCVLAAFAYTFAIELLQLWIIDGRDASVGDLLANTLGGTLGAVLFATLGELIHPSARRATQLAALWSAVLLGTMALTGWAFQPDLPRDVYWGQIGRLLRDFAPFGGVIHRAELNGAPMPDGRIAGSDSLRTLLQRDGIRLEAELTPDQVSRWISPIAVVATDHREEVAVLSLGHNAVVYTGRMRANRLGLHAPHVALEDEFLTGRRVVVSAEQRGARVTLRSVPSTGGPGRELRHQFSPDIGWILLFPLDVWIGDGDPLLAALSALWIAALVLPVAYWGTLAGARADARRGLLVAGGAIVMGFLGISFAFGMRVPGWSSWTLVALGAIVGVFVARRLGGAAVPSDESVPARDRVGMLSGSTT